MGAAATLFTHGPLTHRRPCARTTAAQPDALIGRGTQVAASTARSARAPTAVLAAGANVTRSRPVRRVTIRRQPLHRASPAAPPSRCRASATAIADDTADQCAFAALGVTVLAADGPGRAAAQRVAASPPSRPGWPRRPWRGRRCRRGRLPGGAGELVLAAIAPVAGDRGRVAAGLALGDLGQLGRRRRRGRGRGERARGRGAGEAERGQRRRAGDAVDGQAVRALEALDRAPGLRAGDAVGGDAERALDRLDRDLARRGRGAGGAARGGRALGERAAGAPSATWRARRARSASRPAAQPGAVGGEAAGAGAALGLQPGGRLTAVGHGGELLGLIAPTGLAVGLAR